MKEVGDLERGERGRIAEAIQAQPSYALLLHLSRP